MQSGEIGEFLLLVSVHVVQRDGKIIERFGESTFDFKRIIPCNFRLSRLKLSVYFLTLGGQS